MCLLKKRSDPSLAGALRWSLPYNERCLCQGVVSPKDTPAHTCTAIDEEYCTDDSSCKLWFVEETEVGQLTARHNWNKGSLDQLLRRSGLCGMF